MYVFVCLQKIINPCKESRIVLSFYSVLFLSIEYTHRLLKTIWHPLNLFLNSPIQLLAAMVIKVAANNIKFLSHGRLS